MKQAEATKESATEEKVEAKGGKKGLPMKILVVVLIGAVGFMGYKQFMGKSGPDPVFKVAAVDLEAHTVTYTEDGKKLDPVKIEKSTAAEGAAAKNDPIYINLANGKYLKMNFALEPSSNATALNYAEAADIANDLYGMQTLEKLQEPEFREALKKKFKTEVMTAYADPATQKPLVYDVFVTEFVTQ